MLAAVTYVYGNGVYAPDIFAQVDNSGSTEDVMAMLFANQLQVKVGYARSA